MVSGLSSSTYSPCDCRMAWLLAAEKPLLSAFCTKCTLGKRVCRYSTLPSVLALSTTHTSAWSLVVARMTLRRHCSR